jgi:glycosyltransferase involved in cell wall biosynthesis
VRVSILIPCYNAERWIGPAIESALAQTWLDTEVVVVDDGSTDASLAVIRQFRDRIRFDTGPHRGGNAARNRLLALARGDWLQYLDADDCLLPDKVEAQARYLETADACDVVFGPATIEHWTPQASRRELLEIPLPHDPWVLLARWYLPQTGAPLFSKAAIESVGGWDSAQPCCQEHELYLRLLIAGKTFTYHPSNGAIYRQWSDQTVCRRDPREVRRRRMEIEARAEDHLRRTEGLTTARHWAINQARFEMARSAWQSDHAEALAIVGAIRASMPGFVPSGAAAAPHYRLLYRILGFAPAERLADWRRRLAPHA